MLSAYIKLLTWTVGPTCAHLIQVTTIRRTLRHRMDLFENMPAKSVVYLLWSVFLDARKFFQAPVGELPKSNLHVVHTMLVMGTVLSIPSCPLDLLIPGDSRRVVMPHDGGLDTPEDVFSSGAAPLAGNAKVNPKVHPEIAMAMKALKAAVPNVTIRMLLQESEPPILLKDLALAQGGCLDYLMLGRCKWGACKFKHTGKIDETKMAEVISKL